MSAAKRKKKVLRETCSVCKHCGPKMLPVSQGGFMVFWCYKKDHRVMANEFCDECEPYGFLNEEVKKKAVSPSLDGDLFDGKKKGVG